MKIGVVGSMQHTEKMLELRDKLIALGHNAFTTNLAEPFIGKSDAEKERIKLDQKNNKDAIREFWKMMQGADAISSKRGPRLPTVGEASDNSAKRESEDHGLRPWESILVANYDKNGTKNYIGGNTLMEIGFAHVLNQKIYLLNPIPEIPYYKTEIEAMKPVIINGDLEKI